MEESPEADSAPSCPEATADLSMLSTSEVRRGLGDVIEWLNQPTNDSREFIEDAFGGLVSRLEGPLDEMSDAEREKEHRRLSVMTFAVRREHIVELLGCAADRLDTSADGTSAYMLHRAKVAFNKSEMTEELRRICEAYTIQPRTPVKWSNGSFYAHSETPTGKWLTEHEEEIARDARAAVGELNDFEGSAPMCESAHSDDGTECNVSCALLHSLFALSLENLSVCELPDAVDRVHVRVAFLEAVVGWQLADRFFEVSESND